MGACRFFSASGVLPFPNPPRYLLRRELELLGPYIVGTFLIP